jgi:hypothetical protein
MGICIELLLYMVCDRGRIQRQRLYGLDIRVHVLNLHLFAMAAAHWPISPIPSVSDNMHQKQGILFANCMKLHLDLLCDFNK